MTYKNDLTKYGISDFAAGNVDFAGSDHPLTDELGQVTARCQGNPPWHLPMVIKPMAIIYHLDGVTDLTLSGDVAARIFNGGITRWNDPAIRALNGPVTLPDVAIQVFHLPKNYRDNAVFQSYLKAASHGAWTTDAGETFTGTGTEVDAMGLTAKVLARYGAISYTD
ncbi:substrate-binding domain-containing protein, partial [Kibdelosporangium lantanae]